MAENSSPTPQTSPFPVPVYRHESVAQWFMANPDKSKAECARALGVTPQYIYHLTASDMFREYYRSLSEETFSRVFPALREKMAAVAEAAMDKLADHVQDSQDPSYTLEVADKLLHRLGYAPTKGPTEIVMGNKNTISPTILTIPRELLALAREKVIANATSPAATLPAMPPSQGV